MELANKKVLVVGLGATGVSTALFAKKRGADVTVTDTAHEHELREPAATMRNHRIRTALGGHSPDIFTGAQLVVLSPGVPHTIGPLEQARQKGVPVMGEVELASRFIREPIVAITGTNGKTTTTGMVGEMLAKSGRSVFVGGNIGHPLIEYVEQKNRVDVVVAEISSFQLDTIETFRPRIGVLLNIAEDHLDRYPDLRAYARSKARLFENQQPEDVAVLNGNDPLTMETTAHIRSRKLVFTAGAGLPQSGAGAVVSDEGIAFSVPAAFSGLHSGSETSPVGGCCQTTIRSSQIGLLGRHNLENAAAASLAAMAAGGSWEGVRATLRHARGLAHRLEYVATIEDVRYYNDSKATNVDAVARALDCFRQPVVLLMGGRSKNIAFDSLKEKIRHGVRHLVAFGEAREEIKATFNGLISISMAATMAEAVAKARRAAAPGDVVLLSPACASFDMYASYAERGADFRLAVEKLSG
jgi:UDP-N-acetylmuramoylalanine--D-glutamate ligase